MQPALIKAQLKKVHTMAITEHDFTISTAIADTIVDHDARGHRAAQLAWLLTEISHLALDVVCAIRRTLADLDDGIHRLFERR